MEKIREATIVYGGYTRRYCMVTDTSRVSVFLLVHKDEDIFRAG